MTSPLLDVGLFADRSFSAALTVLLIGLVGVGGTMYLVTQYLQLVEVLTPAVAGLWMGPYRAHAPSPEGAPPQAADRLTDSLGGAVAVADRVSPQALAAAKDAFTTGVNTASVVAGAAIAAAAVLCTIALRHVRPLGEERPADASVP